MHLTVGKGAMRYSRRDSRRWLDVVWALLVGGVAAGEIYWEDSASAKLRARWEWGGHGVPLVDRWGQDDQTAAVMAEVETSMPPIQRDDLPGL